MKTPQVNPAWNTGIYTGISTVKPKLFYLTDKPGTHAAMCDGRKKILSFKTRQEAERYLNFIGHVYNIGLSVFEA